MILPDVNVLVHAHNADSAVHQQARSWWDACLAGTEGVGLAWVALLGFIRITTNRLVLATERGYILHSTDTDFGRFPGLRWVNPCDA